MTKIVAGRVFPIRRPERHLLCYTVKAPIEPERKVFTNNQFGPEKLVLKSTKTAGPAVELCLPSLKTLIGGAWYGEALTHQAGPRFRWLGSTTLKDESEQGCRRQARRQPASDGDAADRARVARRIERESRGGSSASRSGHLESPGRRFPDEGP